MGIDLGTTTTQMILSELLIENTASAFSVPQMEIKDREICYRGKIYFTPLLSDDTLDAEAIKEIIGAEYRSAGINPSDIQTGAVIITGETARKENAKAVLTALSAFAGKFVVATAGPALEGVLAARGAGADRYAALHHTHVLHLDIGGGTTNMVLFGPDGQLIDTGCINVGGRLLKLDRQGRILYRSSVLDFLDMPQPGDTVSPAVLEPLIELLVRAIEEAAGLRDRSIVQHFVTDQLIDLPNEQIVLSFSGGVAALIGQPEQDWLRYGDLGVLLASAIKSSRLCCGLYVLGQETVQATVVGAGSYSTALSGSTVAYRNVAFPIQNLPVVRLSPKEELLDSAALGEVLNQRLRIYHGSAAAVHLQGKRGSSYEDVQRLAEGIAQGMRGTESPVVVCVREDMAKALGQALQCCLGSSTPILCLDGLSLPEGSYLDIAAPVGNGSALPVVVKTLAFS